MMARRIPFAPGASRVPGMRNPMGASMGAAAGGVAATTADNVFVGGLPYEWTEGDLNTVFGAVGPIVSSVILVDKATGRSKGAGLVRFADPATAAYAVQTLNGYVVEGTGRTLEVKPAERPEEKAGRKAMNAMRFNPYGGAAGMAMGGGLGMMNGNIGALAQIQSPMVGPMGAGMFGGRISVPRRQDIVPEEGANLHVFGLDNNVTELHLYQAFSSYGAIRSVRVTNDPATGNPKGYGFVQFYTVQDAMSAMAALNGAQVGTRTWSISVHKKKA